MDSSIQTGLCMAFRPWINGLQELISKGVITRKSPLQCPEQRPL